MIIQGNNDALAFAIPKEVNDAPFCYACVSDATGVLHEWNTQGCIREKNTLVLRWKSSDTVRLPAGPVYIEIYARDENNNMFWSRKIPEYVDSRRGNSKIGLDIVDHDVHLNVASRNVVYDPTEKALIFGGETH